MNVWLHLHLKIFYERNYYLDHNSSYSDSVVALLLGTEPRRGCRHLCCASYHPVRSKQLLPTKLLQDLSPHQPSPMLPQSFWSGKPNAQVSALAQSISLCFLYKKEEILDLPGGGQTITTHHEGYCCCFFVPSNDSLIVRLDS